MKKMRILVIGGGGREHALVWKIKQSPLVGKIYRAPGNPGIAQHAECVPISATNIPALLKFALDNEIDLTVVGPEDPLCMGIVDTFEMAGLKIFGPNKLAAEIEGSKVFAKELMEKYKIPTAVSMTATNIDEAITAVEFFTKQFDWPVVVKFYGLAAGKGTTVCQSEEEAVYALREIFTEEKFGSTDIKVVVEDLELRN